MSQIAWAAALRDARLNNDLTVTKLAQKILVPTDEIQQYEAGTKNPSLLNKMLLTKALHLKWSFWPLTPHEQYQYKFLKGDHKCK